MRIGVECVIKGLPCRCCRREEQSGHLLGEAMAGTRQGPIRRVKSGCRSRSKAGALPQTRGPVF